MGKYDNLKHKKVFEYFEELCNIPHGSGNEKAISDYLKNFGESRGFETIQDDALNILIKVQGTNGYENSDPIILQGHMDMVCEKSPTSNHNFETDKIETIIDGDDIHANETTLGADNGIAIAYSLALIDSNAPHPPLEFIFTTSEEVGMDGAIALDTTPFKGKILLNLDSEEEGEFCTSCAGGCRVNIDVPITWEEPLMEYRYFAVQITGLTGGHSGIEIHKGLPNANILLGRLLDIITNKFSARVGYVSGGVKDNCVAAQSESIVAIPRDKEPLFKKECENMQEIFRQEYFSVNDDIQIIVESTEEPKKLYSPETVTKMIAVYQNSPQGVISMSTTITGLVETSSNLGVVESDDDTITFTNAVRSSFESKKQMVRRQLENLGNALGCKVTMKSNYPGWADNPSSKIKVVAGKIYKDMYKKDAIFAGVHAGLECGVFMDKIKDLDAISFGPNLHDVHTPKERFSISSAERIYDLLLEILKNLK